MMPRYRGATQEACAKCGAGKPDIVLYKASLTQPEHLKLECNTCGHFWWVLPLDAPKEQRTGDSTI